VADLMVVHVVVSFGIMWELARYGDRGFFTCLWLTLSWPYQLGRMVGRFLNAEAPRG